MKITFEGKTFQDIAHEMEALLEFVSQKIATQVATAVQGPGPEPSHGFEAPIAPKATVHVDKPVPNPVEKPKRERTEKQKANDERLRIAAQEKVAAKQAAKATAPVAAPVEKPKAELTPADVVGVRTKTIEDLQTAYANGFQKEVFELLARFGNGAKSFRELPPESFVPIREAIDNGALT